MLKRSDILFVEELVDLGRLVIAGDNRDASVILHHRWWCLCLDMVNARRWNSRTLVFFSA